MTAPHTPELTPERIRAAFWEARQKGPARHRDIASQLGIAEGQLIAAYVGSDAPELQAQRLRPDWPALIAEVEKLGELMALTRNASCVHEKIGVYHNTRLEGHVGLVLGESIDLRIFFQEWAHGFAVQDHSGQADQAQLSLQFFDAAGDAVHKIIIKPQSHIPAYEALCQQFLAADQSTGLTPVALPAKADGPDAAVDVPALRQAWSELRDTHDFYPMLKKLGLGRLQALRLAGSEWAQSLPLQAAQRLLEGAAAQRLPIMVFTGNRGVVQIHSGPVEKIAVMGPWLNVLDPTFNLHLRQDHIASAWLVRKPTADGLVSSLELFDAAGENIALFFGLRKEGQAEDPAWRALLAELTEETPA